MSGVSVKPTLRVASRFVVPARLAGMLLLSAVPGFIDPRNNQVVFSYAHPIFWAPFTLVGDGGN